MYGISQRNIRTAPAVELNEGAQFALDLMLIEDLDYLPVIAPATRRLVGLFSKNDIERNCWGRGHDPERCSNPSHLLTRTRHCVRGHPVDAELLEGPSPAPVVVVDEELRPLGFLEGLEDQAYPPARSSATGSPALASTETLARRVLVVDSDREVRCTMVEMLNTAGYRVRTAPDGSTGLAMACSWQPDLVLMGLELPDLSGWHAGHLLGRGMSTAEIPVVLMADGDAPHDPARLEAAGFVGTLAMPFTDSALVEAVDRAIARAGLGNGLEAC